MQCRQSLRNCDKGFTLLELLVASMLGLMIVALSGAVALANRNLYQYDLTRTRLNQNLRSAMDVMAANVREAGENLSETFPAVQLINGAAGTPDELVIRRNLKDEVLKVCTAISSGTNETDIYFATVGVEPGCAYSDNQFNFSEWQAFRLEEGGTVRAYIYNQATEEGEFFDYVDEEDTGTELFIQRVSGSWQYDYPVGSSAVYLLEEWHFKLEQFEFSDNRLQVIENGDEDNPLGVIYGLTDFQVQAVLIDDTVKDQLDATDNWIDLKAVQITLSGQDMYRDRAIPRSLTARYFPRNVLSN